MSTSLSPRSAPVHPTRQQLDELDALLQRMLDLPVNQVDEPAAQEPAAPPARETRPPVSYTVPINETPPPPRLEPRVVVAEEPPKSQPVPQPVAATPAAPPAAPVARPQPPVIRSQAPAVAAPAPTPAPAADPEPGPDDWVRLASTWQPSAQTWQPLAQSWQQAARPPARPVPPPAEPEPVREPAPFAAMIRPPEPVVFAPATRSAAVQTEPEDENPLKDLAAAREETTGEPAPRPAAVAPPSPGTDWWLWPFVAVNAVFDVATLPLGPLGAGLRSRAGRNVLAAAGIGSLATAVALAAADGFGWIW